MMIMNSREKNVQTKQEGETIDHSSKVPKVSSSSRQWGGFKNPRIVRVSRTFGGKDRHSKVCTIRGLRDRRIRLSVPTAIELYDLQDRLGLNQPSKVVDWLLDATKHDIDKLPPLQMPPGNFTTRFHQPSHLFSHQDSTATTPQASSSMSHFFNAYPSRMMKGEGPQDLLLSSKGGININDRLAWKGSRSTDQRYAEDSGNDVRSKYWGKEGERDERATQQENLDNYGGHLAQLSAQNFFPLANQPSFPGFLNNALPYNSYFHWEPSNLSLSPFGNHSLMASSQAEDSHNSSLPHSLPLPLSSMAAIPSGSHQLCFYPSLTTMPSILPAPFPPPFINTPIENEPRQINHLPPFLSSSNSQQILPNSLMPTLHLMNPPVKSFGLSGSDPNKPPSQEK